MPAPWQNRITGTGCANPADILAHPDNWRIHPKAQQDALAGVLDEVGWVQQVVVNQRTQTLIDGHLRVSLALRRNEPTIPVVYVDLGEAEEALILATLDPLAAMAVADAAKLDALLRDVQTGDAAVQAMLADLAKDNGLYVEPEKADDPGAQIERADELGQKWGTERGQLWEIGSHRLLCGDSTNAEDVARLMDGAKAEMIWTDPPYGVEYVGKTADALTIENDGATGLLSLLIDAFTATQAACVPSAPFYIAGPGGPASFHFTDALRSVNWRVHQVLVWVKDSMVLGHSDYHYQHELVFYGYVPGPGRPGRGNHEGTRWYGDHSQTSVLAFDRPKRSAEHPTMKPPELVAHCVQNSSPAGGIVFDGFQGSGTTIVACEQTARIGYGCELSPKYVAVALERLSGLGLSPRLAP